MFSIYSRAITTIVALSGSNAASGLPGIPPTRRNASSHPIALGLSHVPRRDLNATDSPGADQYVYNSRAWTWQERLISPRSIIFLPEQVSFQCRVSVCCEDRVSSFSYTGHVYLLEQARAWKAAHISPTTHSRRE
jgi:hypothetical protein